MATSSVTAVTNIIVTSEEPICTWTYDDYHCKWDTGCDDAFCFENDGPADNHYRFCPACGRRIVEVRTAVDGEDDEEREPTVEQAGAAIDKVEDRLAAERRAGL